MEMEWEVNRLIDNFDYSRAGAFRKLEELSSQIIEVLGSILNDRPIGSFISYENLERAAGLDERAIGSPVRLVKNALGVLAQFGFAFRY